MLQWLRTAALIAAAAALVLLAGPALGQQTVIITRADCLRLVEHLPTPDVEYRPGVDVRGRPVAGADLDGGYAHVEPPDAIAFPLAVELRNFLGGPEADAQAASAASAAADKALAAARLADSAASQAEAAAAADPGNAELAAGASAARRSSEAANAAVTAEDKAAGAAGAATGARAAAAADPDNAALASAAAAAEGAARDAAAASAGLDEAFTDAARSGEFLGEPVIGWVTVTDHQVTYNGRPLMDEERAALAAACQKVLEGQR
jgi:hypothetical protein